MHHLIHALLPKKQLSLCMYKIARIENKAFKNFAIKTFIRATQTDISEAARTNINEYQSLLDFFTRELSKNARKLELGDKHIISPVDGKIAHIGKIENKQIFQIKGYTYSLSSLVSKEYATRYQNGNAATIYLAPYNYHRIHMPISGRLIRAKYIPGELNSVSISLLDKIPGLFAKNERVVLEFETDQEKQFIMVLVGAVNVGSIETVTHGQITPNKELTTIDLKSNQPYFNQGDEIGRFNLGSTVILITEPNYNNWVDIHTSNTVQLGNLIGVIH